MIDSVVRLRQINNPEVSGFIVSIIENYLYTGQYLTGISQLTGNLTGQFYPLYLNPYGYITTGQTGNFTTLSQLTGNNLNILVTVGATYYPLTNPSGFITGVAPVPTGNLTGAFYPLNSNPSSYIIPSETGNFIDNGMTGQLYINTGTFTGVFYPLTNPSGFIPLNDFMLLDSSGVPSVAWDNLNGRMLIDNNNRTSIYWDGRSIADENGNISMTWGNNQRKLWDFIPASLHFVSLDWHARQCYDVNLFTSFDWNFKKLSGAWLAQSLTISGSPVVNYNQLNNSGTYLYGLILSGVGQSANVVYTTGDQDINGNKTYEGSATFNGDFVVNADSVFGNSVYGSTFGEGAWQLNPDGSVGFANNSVTVDSSGRLHTFFGFNSAYNLGLGQYTAGVLDDGRIFGDGSLITNITSSGVVLVDVVRITGNQNINGIKNFSQEIATPTLVVQNIVSTGNIPVKAYDTGVQQSADFNSRLLTDSSQLNSVNWQNRTLYNNGGTSIYNWQNNIISDLSGNSTIDLNNRIIYNPSGTGVINFNQYKIVGPTAQNINNLGWSNNTIFWNSGILSGNWSVIDAANNSAANFTSRYLIDNTGRIVINWGSGANVAALLDYSQNPAILWPQRQCVIPNVSAPFYTPTLDWGARGLSGSWNVVNSVNVSGLNLSGILTITGAQGITILTNGQTIIISGSGSASSNVIRPTISGSVANNYTIDWTLSDTYYYRLTGDTNFLFTGVTNGQTIVVEVDNLLGFNATWPSGTTGVPPGTIGVRWQSGLAPFVTQNSNVFTFIDINNRIAGNVVQNF